MNALVFLVADQHSGTNSRDASALDTLPLNGNFSSTYSLDDAAFEKMIISELVHNNLRPRGHPRGPEEPERPPRPDRPGVWTEHHPALELLLRPHHREVLEVPLLPERTHSLQSSRQHQGRDEGQDEGRDEGRDITQATPSTENRDSLYTSMPDLRDSSSSLCPPVDAEQPGSDQPCHKSLPELLPDPTDINDHGFEVEGETPTDGQMQLITSL